MGPRPTWLHARARISVPRSPCGESRFSTVTSTRAAARVLCLVPRGQALGVTFQSPDNDRYGYGAADLRGRIVGALGGHAAEELVYGDVTTGAESDLEQLTSIARQMVGRWGMSDAIGKVSVLPRPDEESNFLPGAARASEQTLELVDVEVRRIVDECYDEALEQLRANRDRLDRLARALLEHETLDEADAYRIAVSTGPRALAGGKGACSRGDFAVTARPLRRGFWKLTIRCRSEERTPELVAHGRRDSRHIRARFDREAPRLHYGFVASGYRDC